MYVLGFVYSIALLEHTLHCVHVSVYVFLCTVHHPLLAGAEELNLLMVMTTQQVKVEFIFPIFYRKYSSGPPGEAQCSYLESENTDGHLGARGGVKRENVLLHQTGASEAALHSTESAFGQATAPVIRFQLIGHFCEVD